METSLRPQGDVVAYYWTAYFEWRTTYALSDDCMFELIAAIRATIDSGMVSGDEAQRLKILARMIEVELLAARTNCCAA